jgi:hypothetical protein
MEAWILALIALCAPHDASPDAFPEIAHAIDVASHEAPLYAEDDGVERTAAELVALAAREGHMRADAMAMDWAGFSFGLYQLHSTNFRRLGITWREADTPLEATRAALVLLAESHRVCHRRPLAEQLAHYASGGPSCDVPEGLTASRNRMALAAYLLRARPAFWVDASRDMAKNPR